MIALLGEGPSLQCLFACQTVCFVAVMTAKRRWLLNQCQAPSQLLHKYYLSPPCDIPTAPILQMRSQRPRRVD